eukprot:TRINITY_DN4193_c0_g1_i3.p1 TRINITY_DN4193_c0_g1~~TRINITY_DN4193_c0_g1_i3.p1  ORF type:complete len:984 (-),score=125.52 TRINITY_DN4193_c0_g1_i3:113-3064(-)
MVKVILILLGVILIGVNSSITLESITNYTTKYPLSTYYSSTSCNKGPAPILFDDINGDGWKDLVLLSYDNNQTITISVLTFAADGASYDGITDFNYTTFPDLTVFPFLYLADLNTSRPGKEIILMILYKNETSGSIDNATVDVFDQAGALDPFFSKNVSGPFVGGFPFAIFKNTSGFTGLDKLLLFVETDYDISVSILDVNSIFAVYLNASFPWKRFYTTPNSNYILSTSGNTMNYTGISDLGVLHNYDLTTQIQYPRKFSNSIYDVVAPLASNKFKASLYDSIDYALQFGDDEPLRYIKAYDINTGQLFTTSYDHNKNYTNAWPCLNDVNMDGYSDIVFADLLNTNLFLDIFFGTGSVPLFPEREQLVVDGILSRNITQVIIEPRHVSAPYGGVWAVIVETNGDGYNNISIYNMTVKRERLYPHDCMAVNTFESDGLYFNDSQPFICSDPSSNYLLMVWSTTFGWSLPYSSTSEGDIAYSFSEDSGNSWSVPRILNNNALDDTSKDYLPICAISDSVMIVIWPSAGDQNYYVSYSPLQKLNWTDPVKFSNFTADYMVPGEIALTKDYIIFSKKVAVADSTIAYTNYPRIYNSTLDVIPTWTEMNTISISTLVGQSDYIIICSYNFTTSSILIEKATNISATKDVVANLTVPAFIENLQLRCNANNQCILVAVSRYVSKFIVFHSYDGTNWANESIVVDGDRQDRASPVFSITVLQNSSFVVTLNYEDSIITTTHLITFTNQSTSSPPYEPFPEVNKRSVQEVLVNITVDDRRTITHNYGTSLIHHILTGPVNKIFTVMQDARGIFYMDSCLQTSDILNYNTHPPTNAPTAYPTAYPTSNPTTNPTSIPTVPYQPPPTNTVPPTSLTCFQNFTGSSLYDSSICTSGLDGGTLYSNNITDISKEVVVINSNWEWSTTGNKGLTIKESNITLASNNVNIDSVTTIVGDLTIIGSTLNVKSAKIQLTGTSYMLSLLFLIIFMNVST